ncbi:alpha/beta hydrolase [Brevibacillus ruminantium]|uniref:Alpha/beta hydrolase n=1 Tax=Brevibacillus ruminantium TaxID=2950604 RepID=A0ABY4WEP1_9BACL|nr:alpha/beta hydrolase [Brevibacillus ruminantium]USG64598.1 alpha/beta hydrolase [Brevibacillus ruminantium]
MHRKPDTQINIHYTEYGTGTPLIMLHGFAPDSRLLLRCMENLFSDQLHGWKRIYVDLPGMGKSPGKEWINSSDDMLQAVLDFIEEVIPHQDFVIVGESYGAYLARGIIAKQFERVKGLAMICPLIEPEKSKRDTPEHVVLYKDESFLSTLSREEYEEFTSIAVIQDEYNWRRFDEEILSGVKIADEEFLGRIKKNYAFSFDIDQLPSTFTHPVVILTGKQDSIVGYKDAWKIIEQFPHASYAVLDRAGHNLQIEQADLFESLMLEWLRRVEKHIG